MTFVTRLFRLAAHAVVLLAILLARASDARADADLVRVATAALLRVSPWLTANETLLAETAIPIAMVSSSPRDVFDLVAVGWFESGGTWNASLVGDHGHSRSVFSLWVCPGADCLPVIVDPEYAARLALARIRSSERDCRWLSPPNRWAEFATGKCITNRESRHRYRLARKLEHEVIVEEPDPPEDPDA